MCRLVLFAILCCLVNHASASHIVGGEIYYTYLGTSGKNVNYRVTMNLFIDCDKGNPKSIEQDKNAYFNVYAINSVYNNKYTIDTNYALYNARTGPYNVTTTNYKCIKNMPYVCVDKYTFTVDMSLPKSKLGYVVTFERCCRNSTITNIYDPTNTGATYWTTIPGTDLVEFDNAPQFKFQPPKFICLNAPLTFDQSATDADGDSLVYELYTPYSSTTNSGLSQGKIYSTSPSNFKTITWNSGYNINYQIDGNPTLSINRKTGKLTLTPTVAGQYIVGIMVKSYRKGVLISETRRDLQFNAINCTFDVVSAFAMSTVICSSTPLTFQNLSQGATSYLWDFGDGNKTNDTSSQTAPKYTYDTAGTYSVMLVSKNKNCADTFYSDVTVKQKFAFNLPQDTLFCSKFNFKLKSGMNDKTYQWNTGASSDSITVSQPGTYWLKVSDLPCSASDTIVIRQDLSKVEIGPDSIICKTTFTPFVYQGPAGYVSYLWSNGSRKDTTTIRTPGTYVLETLNGNNCKSSDSVSIILYNPPKININDTLFCRRTNVVLNGHNYDLQTSAESQYLWSTGERTDKITVNNPGKYYVTVKNKYCIAGDDAVLNYIQTGLDIGPDTFYCGPVYRTVSAQQGFNSYLWQDGSTSPNDIAHSPGKYKVKIVSNDGCIEEDSMTIYQYPVLDPGLGNDTSICISSQIILIAADSMISYQWNTGEKSQIIKSYGKGVYSVTVKNNFGCIATDSIRISSDPDALPNEMFMPDAFSPNDDGINDNYPENKYINYGSNYRLEIFNRWGQKIFESTEPGNDWDGKFKGNLSPQDVYIFLVKYVGCDGNLRQFRGTFTLIR